MKKVCDARAAESKKNDCRVFLFSFLCLVLPLFISSLVSAATWNAGDLIKSYIKDNYPWAEVEIRDLVLNGTPSDARPYRIIVEKGLPGRMIFSFEFEDGKRMTVSAAVKAFDRVVVSRGAFKKGYRLAEDDVYMSLMDTQRTPRDAMKDIDMAVGKPLTRSVMANMPLTAEMVSQTPLVKRGQRVTLLVESENVKISALGETKENGSVGRRIKAVNLSSKKTVTGLLVDEHTVRVGL